MKHLLPDPEMEKNIGHGITVYSCEFDSGKRANGNAAFIRLGEDGRVYLLMCASCIEQLRGQILSPLFVEAIQHDKRIPEIVLETIKIKAKGFGDA